MVADTIRTSRIPDLSFIRRENIPQQFDYDGGFPGAPDLAVEIISPTEPATDLLDKIPDYRVAGTEQIWVIYPSQKEIHVYSKNKPSSVDVYRENDILESPTLFSGLKIVIRELFIIEH